MGCDNLVMKAIGDLAVLSSVSDDLDLEDFHLRARHIEDDLENAMEATPMVSMQPQIFSYSSMPRNAPAAEQRPNQIHVTRIFAAATLAQLAALSSNDSNDIRPARVRRAVSRVILEIQLSGQAVTPRQLSWPICVAGCLADPDQQAFFERFLDDIVSEGTCMIGNCGTVRDILKACWANKLERPNEQWDCISGTVSET
ncbi:hypothetical protein NW768_011431 [Fusarium equiseti]|uniref:Uncharacterized protein n=1 Tax=Fusarium equiseti TaxID=61235 RepID=A0ABQ8QXK8_FUSEQ|nr:hypothetical protein NW768_011431 [Fusarium equiseti]